MKAKLTAKQVNSLKPKDKMYKVWDTEIPGFFIRVMPTGAKSYCMFYRHEGRGRDYTIGKSGKLTAEEARTEAREKAPMVARGVDIQEAKIVARARTEAEKHQTLKGFIDNKYAPWVLAERKTGQGTLDLIKNNFSHLYSNRLNKITPWDLQKWRTARLKGGLKPATVNRRITALKAILSKAVEWQVISANPLVSIKPIKLDGNVNVRYLSEEEEAKLRMALEAREKQLKAERQRYNEWREARGYDLYPDLYAVAFADYLNPMVLLALNTGMRRGEIFNLTWSHVDLKRRSLTVAGEGAKSGKTRHIPLNDEAFSAIVAWRNQIEGSALVFSSPVTGGRFDNIRKSWASLMKASTVQSFRFHDLRHTFASKLVMAGVDLNTVRELLGHASIDMTLRYAHLAPEHKANAVALLNKV